MSQTATQVPDADAEIDPARAGLQITHFNFHHRVFQTPGARFLLKGAQRIPIFRVDMGELEGVIDIDVLKKEFHLAPGTHDGELVELAVAGLRYVPDIKPGDMIPSELLTGQASWTVSDKHKRIAEKRLQVQLLSWVSGKELILTDPKEIENFLAQIENREKLRNAFGDAAEALGYGRANTDQVMTQLELLARELCYIEALRDRFALIPKIGQKMTELGKSYGNDRNAKMELMRVQSLLQSGIQEYSAMFTEVDAQTGEIISALKSIDRQVAYIRRVRDDLHFLTILWKSHIDDLDKWRERRTPETDRVLGNLYRFLAPRFTAGRSLLRRRAEAKGGAPNDPKPPAPGKSAKGETSSGSERKVQKRPKKSQA